jgi:hypothetical protein
MNANWLPAWMGNWVRVCSRTGSARSHLSRSPCPLPWREGHDKTCSLVLVRPQLNDDATRTFLLHPKTKERRYTRP